MNTIKIFNVAQPELTVANFRRFTDLDWETRKEILLGKHVLVFGAIWEQNKKRALNAFVPYIINDYIQSICSLLFQTVG